MSIHRGVMVGRLEFVIVRYALRKCGCRGSGSKEIEFQVGVCDFGNNVSRFNLSARFVTQEKFNSNMK
jgi:hypothetical protein